MSRATRPPRLGALEATFLPAAALRAAIATGALTTISGEGEGGLAAGDVARRCGLDPHRTAVMLGVLADAGVVERAEDRFRAHPCVGTLAAIMETKLAGLPAALAADRAGNGADHGLYPHVVGPLGSMVAAMAERVAELVGRPGAHVLDVGAGAAPWSLAVLRREATATLTAVDRPEVVPETTAAVVAAGMEGRATVRAADFTVDDLPTGADVVFLAHVCHLFDGHQAEALVGRAAAALAPGGSLAVIDIVSGPGGQTAPDTDKLLRRYELGLFSRTTHGRVHAIADLSRWCRAAGLSRQEVHPLGGEPPMTLVVAHRP
ncbi:MAG: class I SAM-dependent methyltransferase [Actinomycetota bacterium]